MDADGAASGFELSIRCRGERRRSGNIDAGRGHVVDTTPPVLSNLVLSATLLRPPNHQMVDVGVEYTTSDLSGAPTCALLVSSNEPIDGTGDGDSSPDWEIVDAHHPRLRAERAASGNGRTYTITADCRDRFGNAAQKSASVAVPKSNNGH